MDISVVIPAYNEENYIKSTIDSINKWMPEKYSFEIIVVDHGSEDKTAELSEKAGAKVVSGKGLKTIAALRNYGVEQSQGDILFFIDADITFTQQWSDNIDEVIVSLQSNPAQICGSLPKIPLDSSMLMKFWFDPKSTEEKPKYIGSCHLLTTRSLFDSVDGFPAEMETSEEFTFCLNATRSGASLRAYSGLIVVHHGAPDTLSAFAKREVWHGRGDWTNISSILSSKVAMLTIIFLLTHMVLLSSIIIGSTVVNLTSVSALFIIFICLFSSFMKFSNQGLYHILINSFTFYIYFFARSMSLFSALFSKKYKKRSRSH